MKEITKEQMDGNIKTAFDDGTITDPFPKCDESDVYVDVTNEIIDKHRLNVVVGIAPVDIVVDASTGMRTPVGAFRAKFDTIEDLVVFVADKMFIYQILQRPSDKSFCLRYYTDDDGNAVVMDGCKFSVTMKSVER